MEVTKGGGVNCVCRVGKGIAVSGKSQVLEMNVPTLHLIRFHVH